MTSADVQSSTVKRVIVSYSAPGNILSSTKWLQVQAALKAQLPLRNLHWKPTFRNTLRTIQELDVDFVPLDSLRDEHTQIPATILEKPLLNVYVVVWTNTDLDGYKNTVKKQIKDWFSTVTTRRHQEWLILHIVRPDKRPQGGNFFQLSSVFEKIRTDFNTDKRDRCVQVSWSPGTDTPTVWAELFNKIKDGLLQAFDSAIVQREEEVKRSESQRQMPGWNFCTFFILKESLANSFEGVTLYEDAHAQYDELESSFYHTIREDNLSWFGNLINPASGDDSSPLLSSSKKPYRDLIIANTISIFDFRIYVLSRQCELLARQGQLIEIGKKAEAFLGAFGRRLRDVQGTLPRFFIESWIYSSALSVVDYCDNLAVHSQMSGPRLDSFNAMKGELFEFARKQLDVIGVTVGHLPSRPPYSFTSSSSNPNQTGTTDGAAISNQEILSAIEDAESFYELYVNTTNRAISMCTKAGRKKFALRLHSSLAALDLHYGRFETSLNIYNSLPAHYASHSWTSLEAYMLSKALEIHSASGQGGTVEWIHILLSFLQAYVDGAGSELLIPAEDKVAYIASLIDDLQVAARSLETDLPHHDHSAFSVIVTQNAKIADTKDGYFLEATVRNHLPCGLQVDEISVLIVGRDTERCKFALPAQSLSPGKTNLSLFCPAASPGTYVLESTEIRVSHLSFKWVHFSPPGRSQSSRKDKPLLVKLPEDLLALDIQLMQPQRIELGEPSMLLIKLFTGRNDVTGLSLKFSSPGVTFQLGDAHIRNDQEKFRQVEVDQDKIVLRNVRKDTSTSISLPHSDTSAFNAMKVSIEMAYTTELDPDVRRTASITRTVFTALPIAVNVEDFFRGTRLFSKFTVSTASHQHVRIREAELRPKEDSIDGVTIVSCATKKRAILTVTPSQPVNFLFYIDSKYGPVREPLSLSIRYRMLREEVESVIEEAVAQVLGQSGAPKRRITLVNAIIKALEQSSAWVELYGITGELDVGVAAVNSEDEEEARLLAAVIKLLSNHRHPEVPKGTWREILIPVDVPHMSIVAAACLRIVATPFSDSTVVQDNLPLYAGQPISASLTIHTSFHWDAITAKNRRYLLRYDLEEMVKDWLVSGPKRDDFVAMHDATTTVSITLIALRHGELALPKVLITALPISEEVTMGSMIVPSVEVYQVHGAEKVLVLPRGGRSTFVLDMEPT